MSNYIKAYALPNSPLQDVRILIVPGISGTAGVPTFRLEMSLADAELLASELEHAIASARQNHRR